MRKKLIVLMLVTAVVFAGGLFSQLEAMTGEEILKKMDETMRADSKYMAQEMVLVSPRGSERSREIATWSKIADGSEKMLVRFLAPADIAGTGLLMEGDDMWLYLP
ncbi:MAG: outer membrane lipoprotein-sorting protein, partial [Halarsenatibacteraceae bacterium]